ncbi:polyprenyl synthetase family protein [Intestinibacillus massiliensis]|uniref:polyprenyl synthetase family protein n=1 Tax=Intestinibacillus massiliensis TaxID=1871029 RepID=UPI00190E994B|nr:farnesyl diphosphate synthase [Intestinibacillus massiliensis]
MKFDEQLSEDIKVVEETLKKHLSCEEARGQENIYDAVKYSAFAGGKRLRPVLTIEFCRACGADIQSALPFAAAIEMVHTYSLIHDDLPCMDDDDLRRGRPTNHKVYGEAMAVLAGDGLLNRAFETALQPGVPLPAETVLRAATALARASGMDGMIGGQVIDMEAEGHMLSAEELQNLQDLKTGALIRAAVQMGCIVGGADEKQMAAADVYASRLGLAFQIQDDILDIEGSTETFGKPVGSDAENRKCTYPSLLGLEKCHTLVRNLTQEAVEALSAFGDTAFLRALAESLATRDH